MRSAVSAVVRTTSAERVGAGAGVAPSAARIRSFSAGSRTVIRIPSGKRRTTRPCASSRRRGLVRADEDEVRRATAGSRSRRRASAARIRSRSATSPRRRAAGSRSAAAAMRAAGAATGAGSRRRSSSRATSRRRRPRSRRGARRGRTPSTACGARSGSASRRQRHDGLRRRTRSTPRRRRRRRPDSDRASAAISSGSTSSPVGLFGLQTQIRSAPGRVVGQLRALDPGGDRVQRVGRAPDVRAAAGPEEGAGGERDQPVGAGAGDDLLRLDAGVGGSRLAQLAVRAVRVLVQPREALAERHLRHARQRRHVLVEADDLAPGAARAAPRLLGGRAPRRRARTRPGEAWRS